jgi:hypothetical protein
LQLCTFSVLNLSHPSPPTYTNTGQSEYVSNQLTCDSRGEFESPLISQTLFDELPSFQFQQTHQQQQQQQQQQQHDIPELPFDLSFTTHSNRTSISSNFSESCEELL